MSCNTQNACADKWFDKGEWYEGFAAKPAACTDKGLMAAHYAQYPERWKKVFDFLKGHDLKSLEVGKSELDQNIRVIVSRYTTKDPADERLEYHKKYIDLQYIISGKEMMGCAKICPCQQEAAPYNTEKDTGFNFCKNPAYYGADPSKFFVFFPQDLHSPNLQFGEKCEIHKIIFKVRVD